jgi:hypothetical protein
MTIKHKKASAAGASADPAKVGGDDWNDDHLIDAGGLNLPTSATAPAAPASGMQLYAQDVAGQPLPAFVTANGRAIPLQPSLARANVTMWLPQWSSQSPLTFGNPWTVSSGTAISTGPDFTVKRLFAALPYIGANSAATAGSLGRVNTTGPDCSRPFNNTFYGGFRLLARFGCADAATVAGARQFVGLTYTTFTGDPVSQIMLIGVGCDSGDTNLSIYTNDFSGTATKIPLSASFPAHTLGVDVYDLAMYCPRDGASIAVTVTRVNTGDSFNTSLTTDLPQSNTALSFTFQRGNGPTALATRLAIFGLYIEKEF